MTVTVVHLGPCRDEAGTSAGSGDYATQAAGASRVGGRTAGATRVHGPSRKIGDIIQVLGGLVVHHPERRGRVSAAKAQGRLRPGWGRLCAHRTLGRKAVVAFCRPLRRDGGQVRGDSALRTLRDELLLEAETWVPIRGRRSVLVR